MRIDQLVYLEVAFRFGSMRAAAAHLGIAQPTISTQIQRLEEDLGVVLIVRGSHGVRPTYAAEALLPHLRSALRSVDAMRAEASAIGGLRAGRVRLATIAAASSGVLPDVVARFRGEYPNIHFHVTEGGSSFVRQGVLDGDFDLGILSRFGQDVDGEHSLRYLDLAEGQLVLTIPEAHPLASRDRVRPADLAGQPMIVFQEGALLRDAFELLHRDIDVDAVYYTNTVESALSLVRAGVGLSLAHTLTLSTARPDGVVIVPLDVPWAATRMSVVMRSDEQPSPAARTLMRLLREAATGKFGNHLAQQQGG